MILCKLLLKTQKHRTKPESYYVCQNPEAQSDQKVASPYCTKDNNSPTHASCKYMTGKPSTSLKHSPFCLAKEEYMKHLFRVSIQMEKNKRKMLLMKAYLNVKDRANHKLQRIY